MASRIVQYFADKLRTIKEYPITLTKAVYDSEGNRLDNTLNNIKTKIDNDTFKWNYQSRIVADSAGVFGLTSITGYTPIFAYMIWPTDSAQRYIKIQYNPNQEKFFGNCGVANLGLEVRCLYVKSDLK